MHLSFSFDRQSYSRLPKSHHTLAEFQFLHRNPRALFCESDRHLSFSTIPWFFRRLEADFSKFFFVFLSVSEVFFFSLGLVEVVGPTS